MKILIALLPLALTSASAFAGNLPPQVQYGQLLLKGDSNVIAKGNRYVDIKGKVTLSDVNLTNEDAIFKVCEYVVGTDGAFTPPPPATNVCTSGELNKALKLSSGTYIVNFNNTLQYVRIDADRTNTIALSKVSASKVDKTNGVQLQIDYSNREEQEKMTNWLLITDDANSLTADYDGRGHISKVTGYYREGGAIEEPTFVTVGQWSASVSQSDCREAHVSKQERDYSAPWIFGPVYRTVDEVEPQCKSKNVNLSWDRAYFLTLGGTYILQWTGENIAQDDPHYAKYGVSVDGK